MNDLEMAAANLYDGGWRAANKEELLVFLLPCLTEFCASFSIEEYGFPVDEIEIIIKYLASYEELA